MKKILSILSTGILLLSAFSCTEVEKLTVNSNDSVAPVLGDVKIANDISAAFTPATFFVGEKEIAPTLVTYTMVLVKLDEEAVSVSLKTKVDDNVAKVTGSNLTNELKALGCEDGSTHALELVLRASLSSTANTGYLDAEESITTDWKVEEQTGADPYAGWEESKDWSVIGSIESTGNSWGQDEPMLTDGEWYVCKGVVLTTSDEFKFRKDADWGTNFGGTFAELDAEFEVSQNGPNIKVLEDGTYDLFLNPEKAVAKIIVTGSNAPKDPYADFEEQTEWSVIGSIESTGNSWGQDEPMLTDGTWFVCKALELTTADEFKFRKDGAWTVNFGGDFAALGEEFTVTQDGPNIKVLEDGTYDLLLNPEAAVAKIVKTGDDPEL